MQGFSKDIGKTFAFRFSGREKVVHVVHDGYRFGCHACVYVYMYLYLGVVVLETAFLTFQGDFLAPQFSLEMARNMS